MYNKFTMELTWHNCKTNPPKEFENNNLIVSNGTCVFFVSWHRVEGYWIADESRLSNLENWYWADIEQTVQNEERFRD